jgi:hypothetical protein
VEERSTEKETVTIYNFKMHSYLEIDGEQGLKLGSTAVEWVIPDLKRVMEEEYRKENYRNTI